MENIRGRILGGETPGILDALEILKTLIGMESVLEQCGTAYVASLITEDSRTKGEPGIFDALEILKSLIGMCDGILDEA